MYGLKKHFYQSMIIAGIIFLHSSISFAEAGFEERKAVVRTGNAGSDITLPFPHKMRMAACRLISIVFWFERAFCRDT
jgi:hypothetical protein